MQTLVQSKYSNTVTMLLTLYSLLLNIKITAWASIICLLLVAVTEKEQKEVSIVHHLSEKNISLKCKNFDGANFGRIQHHQLPSLHEYQIDSIIHGGTNYNISDNKLHTTWPHDLANKIIDISNVCKSFGIYSKNCNFLSFAL